VGPWGCLDNEYYGFPSEPGVGMKLAKHEQGVPLADPDFDRSSVPPRFVEDAARYLSGELGLDPARYRMTLGELHVQPLRHRRLPVGLPPSVPGLFLATAGSGHGFKFGSILGKIAFERRRASPGKRWSADFSFERFRSSGPVPAFCRLSHSDT